MAAEPNRRWTATVVRLAGGACRHHTAKAYRARVIARFTAIVCEPDSTSASSDMRRVSKRSSS